MFNLSEIIAQIPINVYVLVELSGSRMVDEKVLANR